MTVAVLSLGSNMGDARGHLAAAIDQLRPVLRAVSSIYRTPPWGPVAQDDFLNIAAVVADAGTTAHGWWATAQLLERAAHRERQIRWGPRTLDVDVIMVRRTVDVTGDSTRMPVRATGGPNDGGEDLAAQTVAVISDDPELILPHPRAAERGFVLVPWAEIEPDAVLPGAGPIRDLLGRLDLSGIERVGTLEQ